MGKIRSFLRRHIRSKHHRNNDQDASSQTPGSSSSSPVAFSSGAAVAVSCEEELERIFKKFDSNGDGRISSTEMSAIFESLGHPVADEELDRMMREVDADGDGFISLEEFSDLMASGADDAAEEEELRQAFAVFDVDRNGAISAEELARVLGGLGESASVAQCRRMIEGVDKNGDGVISFAEFKIMMTSGFKLGLPSIST